MTLKERRLEMAGRVLDAPYFVPVLVVVVVLAIATAIQNPLFINGGWQFIVLYSSPLIILAMAQAPALITGGGGLDLSVGPAAGLIACIVVDGFKMGSDPSTATLLLVTVGLGLISGFLNGFLVAFVRIPAIIATLGTYLVYVGLAAYVLNNPVGTSYPALQWFSGATLFLPNVLFVVVAYGAFWLLLLRTSFGVHLRAVGSNEKAAYTSGVNTARVKLVAYVITGVGVGLGALLLIVILNGADPTIGADYSLRAITAAVLGGVSLMGGRGGMFGAALGGLLIYLIQNFLTYMAVSSFVLDMVFGAALVLAIAINGTWDSWRSRLILESRVGL